MLRGNSAVDISCSLVELPSNEADLGRDLSHLYDLRNRSLDSSEFSLFRRVNDS